MPFHKRAKGRRAMNHVRVTKFGTIQLFLAIVGALFQSLALAAEPAAQVRERLAAGEFGPALAIARAVREQVPRDQLLAEIAAAQAAAGARKAAVDTTADISSDVARKAALGSLSTSGSQNGSGQRGARGG